MVGQVLLDLWWSARKWISRGLMCWLGRQGRVEIPWVKSDWNWRGCCFRWKGGLRTRIGRLIKVWEAYVWVKHCGAIQSVSRFIFVMIFEEPSAEGVQKLALTFFSRLTEPNMITQVVFRAQWDVVIESRHRPLNHPMCRCPHYLRSWQRHLFLFVLNFVSLTPLTLNNGGWCVRLSLVMVHLAF